jgi:hypothetical protein
LSSQMRKLAKTSKSRIRRLNLGKLRSRLLPQLLIITNSAKALRMMPRETSRTVANRFRKITICMKTLKASYPYSRLFAKKGTSLVYHSSVSLLKGKAPRLCFTGQLNTDKSRS